MEHVIERAAFVQQSINNQVTLGRLIVPLAKDEIALVKGINWTFWPAAGDGTSTAATFWGALAFNHSLANLTVGILEPGRNNVYWAHYFIHEKLGTNVAFGFQQMTQDLIIPQPGFPIGGDQGIVTFQDTGINPTDFRVTLWYVRARVGVETKIAIARRTSFGKSHST